jgi:hypothetical protein
MKIIALLAVFSCLMMSAFCQVTDNGNPAYIRADTCWKGFFPQNDQFVEFSLNSSARFQDAFHIQIKPGFGLMLTYAEKSNLESNLPILEAHRKWETDYWKSQVKNMTIRDCKDLYAGRKDILATELELTGNNPQQIIKLCFIGVAGKEGVFVFSFSPVTKDSYDFIKAFISSINVSDKRLNLPEESRKLIK